MIGGGKPTTMNFQVVAIKNEEITTVCNTCLSQGRLLTKLKGNDDLFIYLLGEVGSSVDPDRIYICWECAAVLKKMRQFQWQVQQAQLTLQQMVHNKSLTTGPLSNLCKIKLENLNIFEEIVNQNHNKNLSDRKEVLIPDNNKVLFKNIKQEDDSDYELSSGDQDTSGYIDKLDASMKTSSSVEIFLETSDLVEIKKSDVKIKSEKLAETSGIVKKKRAPRGPLKVTFNNTAIKSNNPNVDLNRYELCFKKSVLTEAQIESLGTYIGEHRKKVKNPKYLCRQCMKDFQTSIDLNRHKTYCHILKEETPGPLKCFHCRKKCPDRSSLKAHWAEHNTMMVCKLCSAVVIYWRSHMLEHAKTHAYLWTCKLCPGFKASYPGFSYHYRTIHKHSICDYCGEKFYSKSRLQRHIKFQHMPMCKVCKICDKEFKDHRGLRVHNVVFHPQLVHRAEQPECNYCVECDKQFPSAPAYRKHLYRSVAHNPAVKLIQNSLRVPCPECGKVFARKQYMNNHYRLFHQKQTKHYCELCDKYLVSAHAKKRHIMSVHQKIREPKTKVCDICGTAFQTNAVLIKHIRTHTGERPYKCAHCPAAFTQSSALHSHTRTQHKQA